MDAHDHVFDASDAVRLVAPGVRAEPMLDAAELRAGDHALDVLEARDYEAAGEMHTLVRTPRTATD